MEARIANPVALLPQAMDGIQALMGATNSGGVPKATLDLVHLRASQVNGCMLCVDGGLCGARAAGESDERLIAVAGWRRSELFSPAERAALDLTEAVTRLEAREDSVPDAVWNEAARHYDDKALAALVLAIGTANLFNRLNIATRQTKPDWN